ncbi:MAG: hypothetical protein IJR61_00135 [Clostridia bacterium]|nr:hypothetical protein [Clostridia bacterium]
MKKKGIICIIMSALLCFGVSCKIGKEKTTVSDEKLLDYGAVTLPEPVSAESADLSENGESVPVNYISDLSGKNVISAYNVKDYGAAANGVKDDSGALISALNDAEFAGGGTVYMPAGKYYIGKQITVPGGVTVAGEWLPAGTEGFENGTTILVGVGKNNNSDLPDDAFIRMKAGSKLTGVNIYYPEQDETAPRSYPYTIANAGYLGYTVENVNIVNAYKAIKVALHNVVLFKNIYMSVIKEGIYSDAIYDIPRYSGITVSTSVWAQYEKATSGADIATAVKSAVSEATAFRFGKIDWAYLYDINVSDVKTAIRFKSSENAVGSFNGQISGLKTENVKYGVSVAELATVGAIVSSSDISAEISAVITEKEFKYPAQIFFNATRFSSSDVNVNNAGDGALLFTGCSFVKWGECVFDNATMGYINADSCAFLQDDSLIAHIGPNVVGSSFVNCTFKAFPTLYNESASDGVYISDLKLSEKAPALSVPDSLTRARRCAENAKIYFAADFGAVADGDLLDCAKATDNTRAIQQALNCAGQSGGVVYIGAGTYYVKDHLVIPEGVELKGVSENNRHFGLANKGTTLVTGHGKGEEYGKPFVSLKNSAGLVGINVFYIDQHYSKNVVYAPTVCVFGDGCYLYNVTVPNAYTGVLVKGKNAHIDYLRTLGLKACLVLEKADGAFVENATLSGGDWQDGEAGRLNNAPPADHWTNFPNYYNEGIYVSDSTGVTLMECFTFGMGNGLHLDGKVENFLSLGLGVDASKNAVLLENSGKNVILVNNQLVGSGNYVYTTGKYSGETFVYGTSCWYGSMDVRCTFDGNGAVYMQQCKIANGGVDVNGSKVYLQNFAFDLNNYPMLTVQPEAEGYMINSVGTINLLKTEGEAKNFKKSNLNKR